MTPKAVEGVDMVQAKHKNWGGAVMRMVLLALTLTLVSTGVSAQQADSGSKDGWANDDNEIGRYTIVPVPGHDALILLDTKTGQNWYSGDVAENDILEYGEGGAVTKKGTYKDLTWQPNAFANWVTYHYEPREGKLVPGPGSIYLPTPPPNSNPVGSR